MNRFAQELVSIIRILRSVLSIRIGLKKNSLPDATNYHFVMGNIKG